MEASRARMTHDRDRLVAFLQQAGDSVGTSEICAALKMDRSRPGYIPGRFPRYFECWQEHRGRNRRMIIDLHAHLRLMRTA
jgi:hypothetical protein